jgi:hypothetical protein
LASSKLSASALQALTMNLNFLLLPTKLCGFTAQRHHCIDFFISVVCSENGLPLARTMNVEYDERAEIKQSETEPTRVHTYNNWWQHICKFH